MSNKRKPPQRGGRRYPWEEWFAARQFLLLKGRDYDCMTHGMAQMIRNHAARVGKRVAMRLLEDHGRTGILVRVYDPDPPNSSTTSGPLPVFDVPTIGGAV